MVSSACRVPSGPPTSLTRTVGSVQRYPCSRSFPSGNSVGSLSFFTRNFRSISTGMVPSSDLITAMVEPGAGVVELLGDDHVAHGIFVPGNGEAQAGELVAQGTSQRDGQQRVLRAVGGEDGKTLQPFRRREI